MFREWLHRFWKGQRLKREDNYPCQISINDDGRLSELATLIERGETSEVSLDRLADLMGQVDPNRRSY